MCAAQKAEDAAFFPEINFENDPAQRQMLSFEIPSAATCVRRKCRLFSSIWNPKFRSEPPPRISYFGALIKRAIIVENFEKQTATVRQDLAN